MPEIPEDSAHLTEGGHTPGIVPDWAAEGARGFREERDSHGASVDAVMAREQTKLSNLKARLTDLGIERTLRDQCYVDGDVNGHDMVTMPWEVIYRLIGDDGTRYNGVHHRMGVLG